MRVLADSGLVEQTDCEMGKGLQIGHAWIDGVAEKQNQKRRDDDDSDANLIVNAMVIVFVLGTASETWIQRACVLMRFESEMLSAMRCETDCVSCKMNMRTHSRYPTQARQGWVVKGQE